MQNEYPEDAGAHIHGGLVHHGYSRSLSTSRRAISASLWTQRLTASWPHALEAGAANKLLS